MWPSRWCAYLFCPSWGPMPPEKETTRINTSWKDVELWYRYHILCLPFLRAVLCSSVLLPAPPCSPSGNLVAPAYNCRQRIHNTHILLLFPFPGEWDWRCRGRSPYTNWATYDRKVNGLDHFYTSCGFKVDKHWPSWGWTQQCIGVALCDCVLVIL